MSSAQGGTKDKLWTRTFALLTVVQTIDLLAFNTITPVIAKYTIMQGAALAASGLAASVFSLAAIFARPLSGYLSDRLGRRSIVLTAIVVSAAMQAGYAFVPGFVPLLALRVVHGFFYALFGTAVSAMALASLPPSRANEGMGWFGASYVVASIIGPAMGVAVSEALGFTAMFLITSALSAASFPLALLATSGGEGKKREGAEAAGDNEAATVRVSPDDEAPADAPDVAGLAVARDCAGSADAPDGAAPAGAREGATVPASAESPATRKLPGWRDLVSAPCIPLAAIAMCFMATWGMIASYIVLVGESRGVQGVALFFVANSCTLFITRPIIGKLTDRYGLSRLILPAIAIESCALLGICLARHLWMFLVSASVKAFGSGGVLPSIQAECGKREPPERAGVAMSTYLLGGDIGYTVGPLIGGIMASTVGYDALFFGTLPITALALVIYFAWRAKSKLPGDEAK